MGICGHQNPFRVPTDTLGADLDLMGTEGDEATISRERPVSEAADVVVDKLQLARASRRGQRPHARWTKR
jgi:hypothetical protein